MRAENEAHLERVKTDFLRRVDTKYRRGQDEHGGRLWEHPRRQLLEELMAEAVDLFVYASTLLELEDCHCHLGRRYRYELDDRHQTGKTMQEIDNNGNLPRCYPYEGR